MTQKPTVVFVPGAWHSPEAFTAVSGPLEAAGYTTVGVKLASVGAPKPLSGFEPDVANARAAIQKACDADQDVVIFMHSYGGVVGSECFKGLTKTERRKEGKTGGVAHLIYCCAFVLPEGVSLYNALQNKPLPWFQISEDEMTVTPATPEKIFYNDLDEKTAKEWTAKLRVMSHEVFSSEVTYAGWKHVPATYLYCEQDNAIPLFAQKGMVENSGVEWRTESFDASHSPFLSIPDKVVEAIRRAAGETL